MATSFSLLVRHADGTTQRHALAAGTFTLGREPGCELVIESADVSRQHARLILGGNNIQVVDLGSTLGTKVNGHAVTGPQRAACPAMLQIGSVSISVNIAGAEADLPLRVVDAAPPAANPDALVPYEFGNEIARGGMGSILEAGDCKIGRKVAVKIMLSELDADEGQQKRFIHEVAVLGRLAHPNIVPVYDLGRDSEGQLYYSMKLVKGRTLQAILNSLLEGNAAAVKQYTLDRLLTIFRKVCDAMAFAHANDIIHRDLKPENIMVGEFGEVLVMDWGLAKFLHDEASLNASLARSGAGWQATLAAGGSSFGMTMDGDIMGTPQYMSPEQAEGRIADMDARSDIWSLGGILYAILTLRPPVQGKTLNEILQKVASGSVTSMTRYTKQRTGAAKSRPQTSRPLAEGTLRSIPPALSAVTMKALSAAREKRYQNVASLTADIEAYQTGFATSAEKAGALKQLTLFMKRHKAASIGIAAVLLIGSVLGTKALVEGQRATRALLDLRRTAPVFYTQAKVDSEEGNFDAAIEKIGYAIQLDDANADYHLYRANLRQSSQDLAAAAEGYRRVLALRPADAAAQANLALCEKLLRESGGAALQRGQQSQLLAALRTQKRLVESAPLAALIDPDTATAKAALIARLREWVKQPGWNDGRVSALPDGTFKVNLESLALSDLSVLKGQPVSVLGLNNTSIADLSSLAGLPLKELALRYSKVTDLSPLRGMPLESLNLQDTLVTDLSPLRGMKLQTLNLRSTGVSDLSPLAGMPLTALDCTGARAVRDLSPVRGAPLRTLILLDTPIISLAPLAGAPLKELQMITVPVADLTPLAQCADLESLTVERCPVSDLSPLAKLKLTRLKLKSTNVTSIAPLRGLPLRYIEFGFCIITDLRPLADCPTLEEILLPQKGADPTPLRKLPKLRLISIRSVERGRPAQTTGEFWKEYDAQQAAGKK